MNWQDTALVIIDLQRGITSVSMFPNTAAEVVANTNALIEQAEKAGGFVAYVHSDFFDDQDMLPGDKKLRDLTQDPEHFADFDHDLKKPADAYVVTKRGFSAFFGTDLDLELRRHGIKQVVLVGISTHVGIEAAARDAYQLNYKLTFVSDAMAAHRQDLHDFAIQELLPMMGALKTTQEVLDAGNRE